MNRLIELIMNPAWNWYVLTRAYHRTRRGLRCRLGRHELRHYTTSQGLRGYCLESTYCRGKVYKP